ncbi:hypothetical protein HQ312_02580 [Rhodococcus sp. BP-316]|uniref:hypothetical protein n=1 Tax=Rhodococcus sp. BP-316 TaxID=2739445 RepID=UPI001C9A40BC|nr:hypothetical protein [Rhodococcus sp. BP-316]MBY6679928.1 hypothetical protein [Rhodococcus sp. BP-316]
MTSVEALARRFDTAHLVVKYENQDTDPNADNPRVWATLGLGAVAIAWGYQGDFERCVDLLGPHVERPEGLCASYHRDLFGEVPKRATQALKPDLPAGWDFDAESVEDAEAAAREAEMEDLDE